MGEKSCSQPAFRLLSSYIPPDHVESVFVVFTCFFFFFFLQFVFCYMVAPEFIKKSTLNLYLCCFQLIFISNSPAVNALPCMSFHRCESLFALLCSVYRTIVLALPKPSGSAFLTRFFSPSPLSIPRPCLHLFHKSILTCHQPGVLPQSGPLCFCEPDPILPH